jgi:hypothetical protein
MFTLKKIGPCQTAFSLGTVITRLGLHLLCGTPRVALILHTLEGVDW